jgi:hypothetical protein
VDLIKNHPEVPIEEEVQENAVALISIQICLKRVDRSRAEHQEDPDVREAGDLLGGRVLANIELLHEGEVRGHL